MRHNNLPFTVDAALRARDEGTRRVARYWSAADIAALVRLAEAQATTRQIALELGRTPLAIRLKASRMGLALTAHEVRRSAKRHAKRQGRVAEAETTRLRKRPRIAITVDFDLTTLTRAERQQLAERLRSLEMEEMEVVPEGALNVPVEPPVRKRRKLKVPKPYNPSAATTEQNLNANAKRRQTRAALGWKRSELPDDHPARLGAEMRQLMRQMKRQLRREGAPRRVSLDVLDGQVAYHMDVDALVDPFDLDER